MRHIPHALAFVVPMGCTDVAPDDAHTGPRQCAMESEACSADAACCSGVCAAGACARAPLPPCEPGGPPVMLASGAHVTPEIALDGTHVYFVTHRWTDEYPQVAQTRLMRMTRGGQNEEVVWDAGDEGLFGLAVGESAIYLSSVAGIVVIPKPGGEPYILAAALGWRIRLTKDHVVGSSYFDVARFSYADESFEAFDVGATTGDEILDVLPDGDGAYVLTRQRLVRLAFSTGAYHTVTQVDGGGHISSPTQPRLALSDDHVFYGLAISSADVHPSKLGEIWRVPREGGAPELVAEELGAPLQLAIDGEHLYWSTRWEGVVRSAHDGSEPEVLHDSAGIWSTSWSGFALEERCIYITDGRADLLLRLSRP